MDKYIHKTEYGYCVAHKVGDQFRSYDLEGVDSGVLYGYAYQPEKIPAVRFHATREAALQAASECYYE